MNISSYSVCAFAIICVICIIISKSFKGELHFAIKIAGCVLIASAAVIMISPLLKYINELASQTLISELFSLLLKALGITLLCKICSDICRDCGENGIASGVETVGKIEILILCVPLIEKILGSAFEILELI